MFLPFHPGYEVNYISQAMKRNIFNNQNGKHL